MLSRRALLSWQTCGRGMMIAVMYSAPTVLAGLVPGRYAAFWNSPWPESCATAPPTLPDFARFKISTNANASFLGETIATIYTAGKFPSFVGMGPGGLCSDGDWNCTKAKPIHGGLPQLVNMSEHLSALQQDIERDIYIVYS